MSSLVYLLPIFGVVGLIYMFILQGWVTKQDAGDDKMQGIAKNIADGAMAFLNAEYRVLAIFVLIASALLGWLGTQVTTSHPLIVMAFIIGAVFSALAGNLGMRVATKRMNGFRGRICMPHGLAVKAVSPGYRALARAGLGLFSTCLPS